MCALASIPAWGSGRAWSFPPWKIPLGWGLRHAGVSDLLYREVLGFLYVLLSLTASQVEGFSGGGSSIASQCGSMLPDNSFHGSTGQSSPSPYTVTVNQTTYQPGDTIQVTLSGITTYKGFLLAAHEEGQNKAVGTFSLGSGTGIVLVPCNGIAASGVSQSNNQPKSSVTVTWTAPASASLGNIVVKSTFMQTSSVFWIAVPSRPSLRQRMRYSAPNGCDVRDDSRNCTYVSVTTSPPYIVEISAPAGTHKEYLGIISEILTNQIKSNESMIVVYDNGTFTVQHALYNGTTFINKTQVEVMDKQLAYDPNIKIIQFSFIIPDNLTPFLLPNLNLTPNVFFVRGSVGDNGDLGSPSITLLTGLSSQVSSSCGKPLFHGLLMLVCWNLFNLLP